MSALNKKVHGRIVSNGRVKDLPQGRVSDMIRQLAAFCTTVDGSKLSSLRLELSINPLAPLAGTMSSDDSTMAALLADAPIEDTPMDERWTDPMWTTYQSMHNKRNVDRETPESLARLRKHIEQRYPDHYATHGHHF
jgi:hypothetical protein